MTDNGDWALDVEEDEDYNDPFDEDGRVNFSKKKLYGRDRELERLDTIYKRLLVKCNNNSNNSQSQIGVKFADFDGSNNTDSDSFVMKPAAKTQVVFLSGYSGSGKTSLVNRFVQRTLEKTPNISMFLTGKYPELRSQYPYSAITIGFRRWCQNLSEDDAQLLRNRIKELKKENPIEEEDRQLLCELIPSLPRLFEKGEDFFYKRGSMESVASTPDNQSEDYWTKKGKIKRAFRSFLKSLSSACCQFPLVIFIDDLQWADPASLDLLTSLLSDKTVQNLMFIGCCRSNEVGKDHPWRALILDLEKGRDAMVERMHLSDLPQNEVCEWLQDTFDSPIEKVLPLTKAIYTKVLGNPFCIMQAIDQLVLKKAVYYDMISFTWNFISFDDSEQMEDLLSDDVVAMVKFKIRCLPIILQKVLVFAAFTRSTFDWETLHFLFYSKGYCLSKTKLLKILEQAVVMGLLLDVVGSDEKEYKFSHDRIQEAATSFLSEQCRDRLRMQIGEALKRRGLDIGEEWMLFTAAHHLNAVRSLLDDKLDLARLNLQIAKSSIAKASFDSAIVLLWGGIHCLEKETRWSKHYHLTLELFNLIIETEFSTGNDTGSQAAINEVLRNAKTLGEKQMAHYFSIELISNGKNRDHEHAALMLLSIIRQYGIKMPTVFNESTLKKAESRLEDLMENRELSDLASMSLMAEDSMLIAYFSQLSRSSIYLGKNMQAMIVQLTAIRICAIKGLSKNLPFIISSYASSLRSIKENNEDAIRVGNVARDMLNSPLFKGAEWVRSMGMLQANILPLQTPFKDSIKDLLAIYSQGARDHELEWGFNCGWIYFWAYFCSGIQMDALTDAKTILFEEAASKCSQPLDLIVLFKMFRQTVLNLRGRSRDPLLLDGDACNESKILGQFEEGTETYRETFRDISVLRLMLACIFGSFFTVRRMIDRLEQFGLHDLSVTRQHFRLIFTGLGALMLANEDDTDEDDRKKYYNLGTDIIYLFKELVGIGSANAVTAQSCLLAEKNPSKKNYDKAIEACTRAEMLHLKALMNERCSLLLSKKKKKKDVVQKYLIEAFYAYKDWGAISKTRELKAKYEFLKDIKTTNERRVQEEKKSMKRFWPSCGKK